MPVLAILAAARVAAAESPNKVVVERVVAVVNNVAIFDSELRARMVPLTAEALQIGDETERKRRLDKLTSQILDEMVSEELIVQAAHEAKIDVEWSEIQVALEEVQRAMDLTDDDLRAVLAAQGYTLQDYRLALERQIMRLRAVNELVAAKVHVTDADVRARYDELQRRSSGIDPIPPFAQMKDRLRNELRRGELDKQTQTWSDELHKKAYIEIKI